ncbi:MULTISPECIES: HNH endonuclease [Methylobacterium]|nr:HNH endonuclease [Methylobacterium sp. PvP109]MCX7335722.1 HNH endonuclease [Hyphomicrobiales bacterium]
MRLAFVFELRPLQALLDNVEIEPEDVPLEELRERAFASVRPPEGPVPARRNIYQRSNDVRAYILARAGISCEGCGENAPFNRPDGSPYLEPHHLRRLSDGGPDDPRFVIGLCPTCHRRAHYSVDGVRYNAELMARMPNIERMN